MRARSSSDRQAMHKLRVRLGPLDVIPKQQPASVRQRQKPPGIDLKHLEAVLSQLEVFDHLCLQQIAEIRTGGEAITREKLLRHTSAAQNVASLEQQGLQSRPGEIRRGHQPVVSATEHDDVVVNLWHGRASSRRVWFQSGSRAKESRNAGENEDEFKAGSKPAGPLYSSEGIFGRPPFALALAWGPRTHP